MAEPVPNGGISFWDTQGMGTTEQQLSLPKGWLMFAVPLAFALETNAFFLYAALELGWSTYDSWWGVAIILGSPLLAGAGIGLAFDELKRAILLSWGVGFASAAAAALLFALPYTLEVVGTTGRHTGHAWTAGFVAALAILPLGSIGAALAASANSIE